MKLDRFAGAAAIAVASLWCSRALAQESGAIHLHMPGETAPIRLHPIRHRAAKLAPAAEDTTAAPAAAAPAAPESSAAEAPAKSAPAKTPGKAAIPFNFGDEESAGSSAAQPQAAPPLKTAALPPHAPAQTAVSPAKAAHAGLSKRGAVLFAKGASDPSPAQFDGVKLLAGDLSTALESGASRVELDAYAGAPGDKSSEARRLSLRRALAVRQLLIDNGVPSSRIDVRALGGIADKGAADRVDVFVRAS